MALGPKICPICREHIIKTWESTCWWCWQELKWHDKDFGTSWCNNLIIFNHIREECRNMGFDYPFEETSL